MGVSGHDRLVTLTMRADVLRSGSEQYGGCHFGQRSAREMAAGGACATLRLYAKGVEAIRGH